MTACKTAVVQLQKMEVSDAIVKIETQTQIMQRSETQVRNSRFASETYHNNSE